MLGAYVAVVGAGRILGVRAVSPRADRARVVEVITVDPDARVVRTGGMSSTSVKERTVTSPRDIRYGDDPIVLWWNKTRYRCRNQTCTRATFTEAILQVPARRRTTTRLRTQMARDIGDAARSVIEVAGGAGGCPGRPHTPRSSPTPTRCWATRRR